MTKDSNNSLTEPLLLVDAVVDEAPDTMLLRTKILMSLWGCGMAIFSQAALSATMWDESILHKTTLSIVGFSLLWSFWTCAILFVGMMAFRSCCCCCHHSSEASPKNDNDEDQETIFQYEAHYVVSALLTISAIWIMNSLSAAILAVVALCILVSHMDQGIMGSYSLVAGTLGLIFGTCSQFILSLCLWKDSNMSQPLIHHIFWFSLVWSLLTVCMTFAGCLSLRWIVDPKDRRAILRMEAFYVAMTLIGICGAWVFLDIAAGLPEQIAPSILMLIASLTAFGIILQCFPEDACLADEIEDATILLDNVEEAKEEIILLV